MPSSIYIWSGGMMVYECELLYTNNGTAYIYGINLIAAKNSEGNYTYYLYNAHGDVVQLVSVTGSTGTVTKSYHYDAFGVEYNPNTNDTNYFRYCGEYFDTETGTYYLRARYYNPRTGRFTSEDTHWNTSNMIYGDEPRKINERKDDDDKLGLNTYTLLPDVNAVRQSGNLYVYGINNPVAYVDVNGNFIITTAVLLIAGGALIGGTIGGFVGNNIANKKGLTGWDKIGYIACGAAVGGAVGAVAGALAAPTVVAATGVAGISITAAGVSTIAAAGTTFGTMGTLIANNPGINVAWDQLSSYALNRMIERGITQSAVDLWVKTGKVLEQGANKLVYITKEGVAILTRAGELVTTYSKADFDSNMIEIIKKLFGG